MKFNVSQLDSEEFKLSCEIVLDNNIQENCKKLTKTITGLSFPPPYILSAICVIGYYKEKTKEGYVAKVFPYYRIIKLDNYDKDKLIDNATLYFKENLLANEFKNEFELLGI